MQTLIAFSSAYPADKGIDIALVLLSAACVVAVLYVLDWARN